jgi:endonuclease YncB( thermonuclease family)
MCVGCTRSRCSRRRSQDDCGTSNARKASVRISRADAAPAANREAPGNGCNRGDALAIVIMSWSVFRLSWITGQPRAMRNVHDLRVLKRKRHRPPPDPRHLLAYGAVAAASCAILLTFLEPHFDQMSRSIPLMGFATIVDGDTLQLGGQRVRLHGIDAPEAGQSCEMNRAAYPCGAEATARLIAIVARQQLSCTERSRDQYGRIVALCRLPDGTDIGRQMIKDGHALTYSPSSLGYWVDERRAQIARAGLWRGNFVEPQDWRAGTR